MDMAVTKIVRELDAKLMTDGTISEEFAADYDKVHKMLNTFVRQTGGVLTAENFDIGDAKLRDWLMILYKQGASQEKLTSYLRCGLAHLSYDFIVTQEENRELPPSEAVTRALQSFKKRKFNSRFFKVSQSKMTDTISLKAGKTSSAVKTAAKKGKAPAEKPAVPSPSAKKKSAAAPKTTGTDKLKTQETAKPASGKKTGTLKKTAEKAAPKTVSAKNRTAKPAGTGTSGKK